MRVAQYLDAIDLRHLNVGHDNVVQGAVEFPHRGLTRVCRLNLVTFAAQSDVQHLADRALVIANENVTHALLLPWPLRWCRRASRGHVVQALSGAQPKFHPRRSDASAARIRCLGPAWSAPTPCLRGLARSGRRSLNQVRCHLRIATETARISSR